MPPLKWKMARVINIYKRYNNKARAVNLKTASGELKRPNHKVVKIPIDEN